jgi:hypothetical protein
VPSLLLPHRSCYLAVRSSDDSEFALVGLSPVEMHSELPQQGCASGSAHAIRAALVSPSEVARMPEITQTQVSTPVTLKIGDLFLSFVDKAEASVPPAETPVSQADVSLAVVSVHPRGVGADLAKEGRVCLSRLLWQKGCYVGGFQGLELLLLLCLG